MQIPTVKIEDGKGDYIVINESDFDKKAHKLFVEKEDKSKGKDSKDEKTDEGKDGK